MARGRSAVGLVLQVFSVLVVVEVSDGDQSRNEGLVITSAAGTCYTNRWYHRLERVAFRAYRKFLSYCNCIVSKCAPGEK